MLYILQTLLGVIEQKHKSGPNLILDCDFEDGNTTDKTENYNFYDNSSGYDVNNNSWYSISNEMEFNDYHYDCNPDFSIPEIAGSSSSETSLVNPNEIRIIADNWDSMLAINHNVGIPKLNGYFVLVPCFHNDIVEKFVDIVNNKSTGELNMTVGDYYGKIIKITENSSTIEVIGDIE